MKVHLNVSFTFDLNKVNDALGNTPNVAGKDALRELLIGMLSEYGSVDGYGDPSRYHPHLENHVSFEINEA